MGNTALHLAALKGHLSICWQIVSRGGAKCLLAANSQNQTPVDAAKENTTTMRWVGFLLVLYG